MSRICWYSNACHVNSGYGQQSAQVLHQMVKDGHEVALTANHGAQVMMNCSHGHPILAEGMIRYSLDAAPENIKTWIGDQPGFGVILFDLWPLNGIDALKELNLACWAPVDHDPVPQMVAKFALEGRHHVIAMSEFGYDRFIKAGIPKEELTYIPHAIDRTIFYDRGKGARALMGIPEDSFLVVTNAANRGRIPVRKAFGEMADAMSTFMRERKDVYWMVHTEPHGHSEGVNIPRLLANVGIDQERVRYPSPVALRNGIPADAIATMMSAADVQLLTSMGEGFGIPAVEGMAVGVPCIVSDFSAQPELIGPHSKKVPVQRVWDEYQVSFFGIPNVPSIVTALQEVYEETKAGKVDRAAVAAATERYDDKKVYAEKWRPLIELMTARKKIAAAPVQPPLNRAQRRARK
jgi:glycosyltransferase involved in cell wall biosynthesis